EDNDTTEFLERCFSIQHKAVGLIVHIELGASIYNILSNNELHKHTPTGRDEKWIGEPAMDPTAQIAEVLHDADPENAIGSVFICNKLPMLKCK
ncbi:unnamed protein product, partial [Porites evermanni]